MKHNPKALAGEPSAGLSRRTLRFVDSWYGVLLLSGLFSFVMMYHYIVPLNGILFTDGPKGNDWGQMVWNLWFVNDAISSGHNPYYTNLLYYPEGANLTHHTLAAGFFPVTFLVKLIFRGDALYPVYAYHIVIYLCFTLMAACSYSLLRELSFTRLVAATAACAYAFSDYYLTHTLHLNLIPGFCIPLAAIFLVRAYKNPRSANLIYAAVVSAVAVYFTEYALYLYLGAVVFASLLLLFRETRLNFVERLRSWGWRRLALSLAVFALIIAPFAFIFIRGNTIPPPRIDSSIFSANLAAFFIPGPNHSVLASIFRPLDARVTAGIGGFEAFLGFTSIIFGIIGLWCAKQKLVLAGGLSALVFYILALGPTLKVFRWDTGIPLPYAFVMDIPPFGVNRTPVRFVAIASFFLMLVAASGISWLHQKLSARYGGTRAAGAVFILLALTIAGAYQPTHRRHPFTRPENLPGQVAGPVFNVPLQVKDGYAALLQVFHHQPIATGYVARNSVKNRQRFLELKRVYDQGGPEFCSRIEAMGFRSIIVTGGELIDPLQLSKCSIVVIDLRTDAAWLRNFPGRVKSEAPQFPAYRHARIYFGLMSPDSNAEPADQYLWYGWSERERLFRWTERGTASLTFGLRTVTPNLLRLHMAPFLVPGKLDRQRLEVQLNDQAIASLTLSEATPRDYEIALPVSALRNHNVLTFKLPDAASPQSLGVSEDTRLLGISVQWLEIVP